ncbi:MAG: hypothetical protein IPM25_08170 [Chloracidobacterium sp.]|nr:hypothetical protein [Chloracidobacterium sp.]
MINDTSLVSRIVTHADELEAHLLPGVDAQTLLKRMVDSGVLVSKFERDRRA